MKQLTNKEYRDRNATTPLGDGIYSLLTPEELKEVKHAVLCAYPTRSAADRKRTAHTLACQPTAAAQFVERVNYAIKTMEARA